MVAIHSDATDFSLPVELRFTAAGEATASLGGVSGEHQIDCGAGVRRGTDSLLEPGSFTFRRRQGATVPSADDIRLSPASARAQPLGYLGSGCSHQPGSASHLCAFAKQTADGAELWVVDLAAGVQSPQPCAESDPGRGCFRLTERLWNESLPDSALSFPDAHRFFGDTLLFFADATSERGAPFAGPVYVWRPGWTGPLQLAENPLGCDFDPDSDGAFCLSRPKRTQSGAYHSELLAGRLGDGTKPLERLATVLLLTAEDQLLPDPPYRFQVEFSPGGEYILWSTRPNFAPEAKQTLYALKMGEPPDARRELGVDVSHWRVSRDGRAVFWLKSANMDIPYQPRGTLEMAGFPEPSPARPVLPDVTDDYFELAVDGPGPRALVLLTASNQLVHVWDANDGLARSERLDSGVLDVHGWSPTGSVVAYSKSFGAGAFWRDLHLAVLQHPVQLCTVGTSGNWGGAQFSSSGAWLAAFHGTYESGFQWDLELISSRGCTRSRMASRLQRFAALADDRFAVLTEHLPVRQSGLVDFGLLDARAGGQHLVVLPGVHRHLALAPARAGGGLDVLYAIAGGWNSDGLYRHQLPLERAKSIVPARPAPTARRMQQAALVQRWRASQARPR
jgi:hypothetical protein